MCVCVCVWREAWLRRADAAVLHRAHAMAAGVGMRATRSYLEEVYFFFTARSELWHRMCCLITSAHAVRSVAL